MGDQPRSKSIGRWRIVGKWPLGCSEDRLREMGLVDDQGRFWSERPSQATEETVDCNEDTPIPASSARRSET
jgi:hypothetical protein